ncbi:unnamed protein product [Pedinophyceae sp. YPF-701]|nr:unnamed protein product [Pedinophyceae sp. YPF-701]
MVTPLFPRPTPTTPPPTEAPEEELVPEGCTNSSVLDFLEQNDNLTRFADMMQRAGLQDTKGLEAGGGPVLVLAPTNDAIGAALERAGVSEREFLADTDRLRAIVLYHLASTGRSISEATRSRQIATRLSAAPRLGLFAGSRGTVLVDGPFGDATWTGAEEVLCSRAGIHVAQVDRVLLPAASLAAVSGVSTGSRCDEGATILSVVRNTPELALLGRLVARAGLTRVLDSTARNLTLLAPDEPALANLLVTLNTTETDIDPATLRDILSYHVLPDVVLRKEDIRDGSLRTLEGESVVLDEFPGGVVVEGAAGSASFLRYNLSASTGRRQACSAEVHVIDAVLAPDADLLPAEGELGEVESVANGPTGFVSAGRRCRTVGDIVNFIPALRNLTLALRFAGTTNDVLVPSADQGPVTIFAPSNNAFDSLVFSLGIEPIQLYFNKELLRQITLYHVATGGARKAFQLSDGAELPTLARPLGDDAGPPLNVEVKKVGRQITIEGAGSAANVEASDIEACDAVIHVVDTVLLPNTTLALDPVEVTESGVFVGGVPIAAEDAATLALSGSGIRATTTTRARRPGPAAPAGTPAPGDSGIRATVTESEQPAAPASPTDCTSVVDLAQAVEQLSSFAALIEQAGIESTLGESADVTVLAPTDEAINAMLAATSQLEQDALESPAGAAALLKYHILPGQVTAQELGSPGLRETLAGGAVGGSSEGVLDARGGTATITVPDVRACRATVHIVDKVLSPPEGYLEAAAQSNAPAPAEEPRPGRRA